MLAYLANTLIFIMVGVVIMEKALNSLNEYDLFLLVVDYFGITVIRFVFHTAEMFSFSSIFCYKSQKAVISQANAMLINELFHFLFQGISYDDI